MKKIFTLLALTMLASVYCAQIVINEIYGGGGNSGSTYKHDFVELINNSNSTVTLTGATLQYASSAGTFNVFHILPSITLNAGQTYLIQEAAGTGGSVDLTPDYIAPNPTKFSGGTESQAGFNMSGTNLKIVLASNAVQVVTPSDANVLDFVGVGTASLYEGSGAAPAMSSSKSVERTNGVDTNNNAADFIAGAPTPQSSLGVSDLKTSKIYLVKNTNVGNTIVFGVKADIQIVNVSGQVVKSAAVNDNMTLDVSSLPKGIYLINADVDGQKVSQKILKN